MKLRPPAEKRKRKHRGPEGSQKSSWRILICRMEKGGKERCVCDNGEKNRAVESKEDDVNKT